MKNNTIPLIIGGEKITTKKIFTVKNPATEKISDKFCIAGQKEIDSAIDVARKEQIAWAETSIFERKKLFKNLEKNIIKESDNLLNIATKETGKTHAVSLMDISVWLEIIDYYYKNAEKFLATKNFPKTGDFFQGFYKNKIIYKPFGVMGILVPWNWPILLAAFSTVPAIMAGNAILYKPSEYTGALGYKITELYHKSGFPKGLVNLLNGPGSITGDLLTKSQVDKVVFTGSARAGKIVAHNCADNLTPYNLELGGLDAMIVLEDARIEEAVNGAMFGNFINSGHTCEAPKRIYVHHSIYPQFIKLILDRVKNIRVGPPAESDDIELGPIAHENQFKKIEKFVADAVSKGAKILYGGKVIKGKGFFYMPTIITNIKPNMMLTYEEPFGPIMPIMSFKTEEEVIKKANNTAYGLGLSIWSKNIKRADKIAEKIDAGVVWINEIIKVFPELPFGGVKNSGIGRELGKEGIREYVYPCSVIRRISKSKTRPWWFPHNRLKIKVLKMFFYDFMHSHKKLKKMKTLLKMALTLPRQNKDYKNFSKK